MGRSAGAALCQRWSAIFRTVKILESAEAYRRRSLCAILYSDELVAALAEGTLDAASPAASAATNIVMRTGMDQEVEARAAFNSAAVMLTIRPFWPLPIAARGSLASPLAVTRTR